MLGVLLDLSLIGIHKGLEVTQTSTEERLELVPRNWDKGLCFMSPLVLLPGKADPVPEEGRGKKNSGRPRDSGGSKVVLTLLTKVVAVYVGLSAIYVRRRSLQLLPGHLRDNGS